LIRNIRNKRSCLYPILGRLAKVCCVYIQVVGKLKKNLVRKTTLFLLIILASCSNKLGTTKFDKQMNEVYLDEFKITYFKSLLRKGFNNSKDYDDAVKIDRSHFAEPILTQDDYTFIDSLTSVGNKIMTKDSIESFEKRAEGAEGKQVFYYVLDQYNSKWLDSIAHKRLKKKSKANE
jgi:hypothetical protein